MLLNLDGLVGPSHHFGGLAYGNLASARHHGNRSNPRQAALQGLKKMWYLHCRGFPQAILPPAQRPELSLLRAAGFSGDDNAVVYQASRQAPQLLSAAYSASSMWAANAATVTATADSHAHRLQFTPANLVSTLHRSIECCHNSRALQLIFADRGLYQHHPALPAQQCFSDEGAANHIRLFDPAGDDAINLFVYGRNDLQHVQTGKFPARQSQLASESIARLHRIPSAQAMFVQQSPAAINAGAFHNDVVAVGYANLLLLHAHAFADQPTQLDALKERTQHWQTPLQIIEITNEQLPLNAAINCYLFNSQLLHSTAHGWIMLAPHECAEQPEAQRVIENLLASSIDEVVYFNLRESMHNGGGPACLRLAVPLTEAERSGMHQGVLLSPGLYQALQEWIICYYRDQLSTDSLADPSLRREHYSALEALERILQLPGLYQF
ncbi:N-succinylarginine dihydrolase [Pontibacter sp. JAM-7]|uniref:N-succinylarginine dihydrolase n=1 Tax=Pontibacter sp. JAM-7 TaxID=3366581 RepID=UPI003AF9DF6B